MCPSKKAHFEPDSQYGTLAAGEVPKEFGPQNPPTSKMYLLGMGEVLGELQDRLRTEGKLNRNPTPEELLLHFVEAINKKCSEGYEFRALIYCPVETNGAILYFVKSDRKPSYRIIPATTFDKKDVNAVIETILQQNEIAATLILPGIVEGPVYLVWN